MVLLRLGYANTKPCSPSTTPLSAPTPGRSPPLAPLQPYLRGAERVDAALQGLAQAAVGLLHALHLEGQWHSGEGAAAPPPPPPALTWAQPSPGPPGRPAQQDAPHTLLYRCPEGSLRKPSPGRRGWGWAWHPHCLPSAQVRPPSPQVLPACPLGTVLSSPHPYLALEGDELRVEPSEREAGQVRTSRHGREALGAQVHALGWAPPSAQRVVAVLRHLYLLLPGPRAGI